MLPVVAIVAALGYRLLETVAVCKVNRRVVWLQKGPRVVAFERQQVVEGLAKVDWLLFVVESKPDRDAKLPAGTLRRIREKKRRRQSLPRASRQ
jgi:hypothetical protein